MKKLFFVLFLFSLMVISACSSEPTMPENISRDMYNNVNEVLSIYTDFVENGKDISDEQNRKIEFYFTKYTNADSLTQQESSLMIEMVKLRGNVDFYNTAYQTNNYEDKKTYLEGYMKEKKQVESMLNISEQ